MRIFCAILPTAGNAVVHRRPVTAHTKGLRIKALIEQPSVVLVPVLIEKVHEETFRRRHEEPHQFRDGDLDLYELPLRPLLLLGTATAGTTAAASLLAAVDSSLCRFLPLSLLLQLRSAGYVLKTRTLTSRSLW
jgi:hypothetical protein